MSSITITYSINQLPFIQIDRQHLYINAYFALHISKETWEKILVLSGVKNSSDDLVHSLLTYQPVLNGASYTTVKFSAG